MFKFVFSLLLYLILSRAGFIQDTLFNGIVIHIDRADHLCNGRHVPYKAFLKGIKTVSTKVLVENFTSVVSEGGVKKVMLTITIKRCRSKENLDTCEEYFKQGNIDFCKAIDPSNLLTRSNPFRIPLVPPLKCPINKGVYYGHNISFDLAPFIVFQVEGWYWRIKSELVSEQSRLLACSFVEGYATKSKSKTN